MMLQDQGHLSRVSGVNDFGLRGRRHVLRNPGLEVPTMSLKQSSEATPGVGDPGEEAVLDPGGRAGSEVIAASSRKPEILCPWPRPSLLGPAPTSTVPAAAAVMSAGSRGHRRPGALETRNRAGPGRSLWAGPHGHGMSVARARPMTSPTSSPKPLTLPARPCPMMSPTIPRTHGVTRPPLCHGAPIARLHLKAIERFPRERPDPECKAGAAVDSTHSDVTGGRWGGGLRDGDRKSLCVTPVTYGSRKYMGNNPVPALEVCA